MPSQAGDRPASPRPFWEGRSDVDVAEMLAQIRRMAGHLLRSLPPASFVQLDDLCSAGQLALVEAARRFDATRGADFWTFVRYRIHGAMLDELRSQDTGRRRHRDGTRIRPRLVEMEAAAHIADEAHPDAEDELARLCRVELVHRARQQLPERLRLVLEMHIERDLRVKDIAEHLGVTQGRACQLVTRAIERLREALAAESAA